MEDVQPTIAEAVQHEPSSIKEEQPPTEKKPEITKSEDPKPAPRKLTLQEYLSMRRGNLPTPDEKPPA
jgi:hypothetical protein